MESITLKDRVDAAVDRARTFSSRYGILRSRYTRLEERKLELEGDVRTTRLAATLLQEVSNSMNEEVEHKTAELATLALREAFPNQKLTFKVVQEVKRGQPSVSFLLRDELTGVEDEPLDSFGGGPAALLGVLLQVIATVRHSRMRRFLILDEPLAQVSAQYAPLVGKFLRKLCEPPPKGLGFHMLVVTHSEVLAASGHHRYHAEKRDGRNLTVTQL